MGVQRGLPSPVPANVEQNSRYLLSQIAALEERIVALEGASGGRTDFWIGPWKKALNASTGPVNMFTGTAAELIDVGRISPQLYVSGVLVTYDKATNSGGAADVDVKKGATTILSVSKPDNERTAWAERADPGSEDFPNTTDTLEVDLTTQASWTNGDAALVWVRLSEVAQ